VAGWSFQEVFLLMVIGLIVLGPKRLPQVANQLGSWLGQARRMTRMMKRQLEDELNFDLDSVNVKKSLGLDDDPAGKPKQSAYNPAYVHDRKPVADSPTTGSVSADDPADADGGEQAELPDDYSPAHAAGEAGTGVGDEAETIRAAATESVEEDAADAAGKKETA